jgi:hypothetical protein
VLARILNRNDGHGDVLWAQKKSSDKT